MNAEKLWLEFSTLPPQAQTLVLEFIAFMQKCYAQIQVGVTVPTRSTQEEMKLWFEEVRQEHPFAKMSKEEILVQLRRTREEVYDELYGDRYAN